MVHFRKVKKSFARYVWRNRPFRFVFVAELKLAELELTWRSEPALRRLPRDGSLDYWSAECALLSRALIYRQKTTEKRKQLRVIEISILFFSSTVIQTVVSLDSLDNLFRYAQMVPMPLKIRVLKYRKLSEKIRLDGRWKLMLFLPNCLSPPLECKL